MGDLEDLVSRAAPGQPVRGLEQIDGTDSSGTVYAVVDLTGALLRIGLDDSWWEQVGPRTVGPAILQAVRGAKDKAAAARMMLHQHGHEVPAPAYDPASAFTDMPPVPLPDYDSERFQDVLARNLRRAEEILTNADRFSRLQEPGAERTVSGPRGLFSVVVRGSQIIEARVDTFMVGPGSGAELALDARDALRAVQSPRVLTGEA
ncbi:hypothetical protein BG844_32590 [Couchioplanes caeruleus subsp. caeruleus]|uniref:Uncharacterized protein n=1 Tax=Couchioplanes caeruleus subsp. caeruleus TaxID=56427 RepID=A0A1K0GHD5_9ACTN|nr:hypothetical protein BG844_32590 [Couchioplanes caeruleus subsp. caeruleus]